MRVLRANAVTAGLDPAFTVLDEGEARALRTDAFERALAVWLGNGGQTRADALDVAAAYGIDQLRRLVWSVHDGLRSRGQVAPRLPTPRARRTWTRCAPAAGRDRAGAGGDRRAAERHERAGDRRAARLSRRARRRSRRRSVHASRATPAR